MLLGLLNQKALGTIDEYSPERITLGPVAVHSLRKYDFGERRVIKRLTIEIGELDEYPHPRPYAFFYANGYRSDGSWVTARMSALYQLAATAETEVSTEHPRDSANTRMRITHEDAAQLRRWLNQYGL